jgi:repressor LexA
MLVGAQILAWDDDHALLVGLQVQQHQGRFGQKVQIGEIAAYGAGSPNGVVCHLKALEKKGLIHRNEFKARAIELPELQAERKRARMAEEPGLPFAGVVPAGFTTRAFDLNERIDFDELFGSPGTFVLRVKGDSMIEAHIADGDFVICRSTGTAERGQMVVALNGEDEATLKYWYPERHRIRLQPANREMPPIYVKNVRVRGVVFGVVRSKI